MAHARTAWHLMFYALLQERRPAAFEVLAEVPLSHEPQRADFLLLRRRLEAAADDARVVRELWPRIRLDALIELKTRSSPLRPGDLSTLLGYGAQYAALERDRLGLASKLLLVLAVPFSTPTLSEEVRFLGAELGASERGYAPLAGLVFPACVMFLEEVSEADRDEVLGIFGRRRDIAAGARRWLHAHLWRRDGIMEEIKMEELEGYDDLMIEMLAALPPERLLAALPPERLLAALTPERLLAALTPEQFLAGLAPAQLRSLLEVIRRKLGE